MPPLIVESGSGSIRQLPLHKNLGLEIIVIRRGHLAWRTEDIKEWVTPGTVYFTLPGQIHGSEHEFEPGHEWVYAVISTSLDKNKKLKFHPDLPFSAKEAAEISRSLTGCKRHAFLASPALGDHLSELVREVGQRNDFHRAKIRHLAAAVVIELVRSVAAGKSVEPVHVRPAAENRVLAVIEKLQKQPGEKWTLPQLAADCRLGRSQFSTIFLRLAGDTLIRFLNRIRIQLACRMLKETKASITRIALECGFESSQYFARVFKQFTGGIDARTYRILKSGQCSPASSPKLPPCGLKKPDGSPDFPGLPTTWHSASAPTARPTSIRPGGGVSPSSAN